MLMRPRLHFKELFTFFFLCSVSPNLPLFKVTRAHAAHLAGEAAA